jgi:hypothetical protein
MPFFLFTLLLHPEILVSPRTSELPTGEAMVKLSDLIESEGSTSSHTNTSMLHKKLGLSIGVPRCAMHMTAARMQKPRAGDGGPLPTPRFDKQGNHIDEEGEDYFAISDMMTMKSYYRSLDRTFIDNEHGMDSAKLRSQLRAAAFASGEDHHTIGRHGTLSLVRPQSTKVSASTHFSLVIATEHKLPCKVARTRSATPTWQRYLCW